MNRHIDFDCVLRGGTVVLETKVLKASIGITNGKIAAILDPDVEFQSNTIFDVSGCVVFPGAIDPHVHLWEPGPHSEREDFLHGSHAAAAGGVTTMIEMPLSVPPVIDADSFQLKLEAASKNAVVDFALWGGLTPASTDNLETLHELGCVGFKAFMSYMSDEYPHTSDYYLYEGMKNAAKVNGLVGVHAENAEIVDSTSKMFENSGVMDPEAYSDARPIVAELDAMQRAILFTKFAGNRLHIVHMTAPEGGEMVREAKNKGIPVTNETCPHYLVFDSSDLKRKGVFAKCNPPLRSEENKELLWEQIKKGNIDCIASDHGPYTDEEKLEFGNNIWKAPPGFGSIELLLHVMISEGFHKRELSLESIAKLTSTNVAKIFNLYPRKGTISVGADADLSVVNLHKEWVYKGEKSFSKTKSSNGLYENFELKGKVVSTFVRGQLVYNDEEIIAAPGHGVLIK